MEQQINLFQPIFRKERKRLSFNTLMQMGVIAIVSLLTIYALSWWQISNLDRDLASLSAQYRMAMTQLEKVTRQAAAQPDKDSKAKELERLQAELSAERYLMAVLDKELQRHSSGFSDYLQGFARRMVAGMWLTGFKVFNGGETLQLSGGATGPELLPEFLQQLKDEPRLAGTQFSMLKMQRESPNKSWIEFTLTSGTVVDEGTP